MTSGISIIVPVYNASTTLHRCIDSILAQDYDDWELLLIDDGSADSSHVICCGYAQRDRRIHIYHKTNGGVSSARNVGLAHAKYDWVTFCDADDWFDKYALSTYMKKIRKYGDVDIVRCGYSRELNSGSKEIVCVESDSLLSDKGQAAIIAGNSAYYGFLWNSLFKRKMIDNLRFDESLSWCEDHLFTYTYLCQCSRILFVSDVLYHYVINESNSLSSITDPFMKTDALLKKMKIRQKLLSSVPTQATLEMSNCTSPIADEIIALYRQDIKYQQRKNYRQLFSECHYLHFTSRSAKLFFSRWPFPIVDLLLKMYISKRFSN